MQLMIYAIGSDNSGENSLILLAGMSSLTVAVLVLSYLDIHKLYEPLQMVQACHSMGPNRFSQGLSVHIHCSL